MREIGDFEGRWAVARTIHDNASGERSSFSGLAVLTPEPGGLLYRETGTLRTPAGEFAAERRYRWLPAGADGIAVTFEDGRPFHLIGPGERPEAEHDCPPDIYRVAYDFSRWPAWEAIWRVSGPRKDYDSRTRYTSCDGSAAGAETVTGRGQRTETTP